MSYAICSFENILLIVLAEFNLPLMSQCKYIFAVVLYVLCPSHSCTSSNTLSYIPDTSLVLLGIACSSNVETLSLGTFIGISPYVVFNILFPSIKCFFIIVIIT